MTTANNRLPMRLASYAVCYLFSYTSFIKRQTTFLRLPFTKSATATQSKLLSKCWRSIHNAIPLSIVSVVWDNTVMEKRDELQELRVQIDLIDRGLITSLAERTELVEEIGRYKIAHNIDALDADRRDALLAAWIKTGKALSLPDDLLRDIFSVIHNHSLAMEKKSKNL